MNVFEDFVVELKEANLLEETVIDRPWESLIGFDGDKDPAKNNGAGASSNGNGHHRESSFEELALEPGGDRPRHSPASEKVKAHLSDQLWMLQFVEFVISASERKNGTSTLPFDDLPAKKAFHHYVQSSADQESEQFIEAQSALRTIINEWTEDLTSRDSKLPASIVRSYAESASPPLSPQALFAMLRFYRTVPVSESAFVKFDFFVTRLFSKFVDGKRRELLCPRSEVVKYLTQRYSEWGIDAFKSLPTDDPDIALLLLSINDIVSEAEQAAKFSELAESDLFVRYRELKRESGAVRFVPQVTAALVESNLRISGRVIDLTSEGSETSGHTGFAAVDNSLISDTLARTFEFGEFRRGPDTGDVLGEPRTEPSERTSVLRKSVRVRPGKKRTAKSRNGDTILGVNRWLLLVTILAVVASAGIYIWSEYFAPEAVSDNGVRVANIEDPDIKKYVKTAKISGDMLYAVVTPEFEQLGIDQKREVAVKLRVQGDQMGYKKVTLVNSSGKNIGFSAKDRIDITGQ